MSLQFIISLTEHRNLGYVLVPCLIARNLNGNFYTVVQVVCPKNMQDQNFSFSCEQKELIALAESFSDENLMKRFSSSKSIKVFFEKLNEDAFTNIICPFIDEQLSKMIDIVRRYQIPLFRKESKYCNLYEEDRIETPRQNSKAIFNFQRSPRGTSYTLTIQLDETREINLVHKQIVPLTNSPCHFIYNRVLYRVDGINGQKMIPFFTHKSINIPASVEKKYFESFVLNAFRNNQIIIKGIPLKKKDSELSTQIILNEEIPSLQLSFCYNGHPFKPDDRRKPVFMAERNGKYHFYKFERDYSTESSIIREAEETGLKLSGNSFILGEQIDNPEHVELYELVNWINHNAEFLKKHKIEIQQGEALKKYFTGKQELKIEISENTDWFDLYAIVSFGDFKIPFIRLKRHIIHHIREFELPNGEVAILPKEWFSKYKDILTLGDKQHDQIRLKKHHFNLLGDSFSIDQEKYLRKFENLISHPSIPDSLLPTHLKAQLRVYQQEGYAWMYQLHSACFGGCLADDMGLGKTIQTLTFLQKLKEDRALKAKQINGKKTDHVASMIVMPTSLIHNWENEIKKFTPKLKAFKYIGINRKRKHDFGTVLKNYDLILTTYGTVRNDSEILSQYPFYYIILDEGQNIKNPGSKIYKAVTSLQSKNRLVLTGTPIENSLSDLWAQLNFLNPGLVGSLAWFKREFIAPIEKRNNEEQQEKLQKLIQPFILRRTKEEVAKDLPPVTEQVLLVEMTPEQKKMYDKEKSEIRNSLIEGIEETGIERSALMILQGLTKMRQLANHPVLTYSDYQMDSGKFNEILRNMQILVAENHKILVFSSFVKHLEIIERGIHKKNWKFSKLTGQTQNRKKVIEEFRHDEEKKIFLISLKAGGVGLNLTEADYVFIVDPWWNPAAELQAINRSHRIGQSKNVFVYRFITEGTIEEKIQQLKERKSALADKFINSNNPFKSISREEILGLFK